MNKLRIKFESKHYLSGFYRVTEIKHGEIIIIKRCPLTTGIRPIPNNSELAKCLEFSKNLHLQSWHSICYTFTEVIEWRSAVSDRLSAVGFRLSEELGYSLKAISHQLNATKNERDLSG